MNRNFKGSNSLDRRPVVEPSLSRLDAGIINEAFDSFTQLPSPSFFYVDNTAGWMSSQQPPTGRRFTESWIELEQAYSCGSDASSRSKCRCCCPRVMRFLVYAILVLSLIGFAAIAASIVYMELILEREPAVPFNATIFNASSTEMPPDASEMMNGTIATLEPLLTSTLSSLNSTLQPNETLASQ